VAYLERWFIFLIKFVLGKDVRISTVDISLSSTMRPKTRGLAQHGGPPGWLEESDPAGCDFVRDGR